MSDENGFTVTEEEAERWLICNEKAFVDIITEYGNGVLEQMVNESKFRGRKRKC